MATHRPDSETAILPFEHPSRFDPSKINFTVDIKKPPFPYRGLGYAGITNDIYIAYRGLLVSRASFMLRDEQSPEEIAQTTFIKAMRSLENIAKEPPPPQKLAVGPWLFTIQERLCLDEIDRRKIVGFETFDPRRSYPGATAQANHLGYLIQAETSSDVRGILNTLKPLYGEILQLFSIEEMSMEEAAERLGISRSAAKSRAFRARQEFKQEWIAMHPDDPNPLLT